MTESSEIINPSKLHWS